MCSKRLTLPKLGGWVADLVCNDKTRTAVLVSNFFSQISSLMREIRRYHINFATFLLLDCEFHFDPVKSTVCAHISPRCKSFTLRKSPLSLVFDFLLRYPLFLYTVISLALARFLLTIGTRGRGLPPGPPTLPIIGNLNTFPRTKLHLKFTEFGTFNYFFSVSLKSHLGL